MSAGLTEAIGSMGAEMRTDIRNYITAGDDQQWSGLPQGMVAIHCTHSNLMKKMIELKFDLHTTIGDLKARLHMHCGTPASAQRLILRDGGQDIAHLDDDSKMMGFYSIESGMTIHIIDTDPFSMSRGGGLEDVSLIQKYKMDDETYEARKGTVRQWIKEQKEADPNWKPPKQNNFSGNPWEKQPPPAPGAAEEIETGPETVAGMEVGMRCECQPGARRGEIAYVGEVAGLNGGGHWLGVRFDEPVGRSNGVVKGETIFECMERYGGFLRGKNVTVGDFPEAELDLEDTDEEEDEL